MSTTIGKYLLHSHHSLILPSGESAVLHLNVNGWSIQVRIQFEFKGERELNSIDIRGESDSRAVLALVNWRNSLGTALKEPVELGRNPLYNVVVHFMVCHWAIGDGDSATNRVDLQILTGG